MSLDKTSDAIVVRSYLNANKDAPAGRLYECERIRQRIAYNAIRHNLD